MEHAAVPIPIQQIAHVPINRFKNSHQAAPLLRGRHCLHLHQLLCHLWHQNKVVSFWNLKSSTCFMYCSGVISTKSLYRTFPVWENLKNTNITSFCLQLSERLAPGAEGHTRQRGRQFQEAWFGTSFEPSKETPPWWFRGFGIHWWHWGRLYEELNKCPNWGSSIQYLPSWLVPCWTEETGMQWNRHSWPVHKKIYCWFKWILTLWPPAAALRLALTESVNKWDLRH